MIDRLLGLLAWVCLAGAAGLVVVAVLMLTGVIDTNPADPCAHTRIAGKVVYVIHDKGWQTVAGRPVWCGPGSVPR